MIDLRSDTVTKPTPEMRAAMAAAEVGDDVYGEDPTVNRLEERAAAVFEKEAALFVASGTMGNQIAVKVHTRPGQEVVIEERSHIFNYELGMASILSGITFRTARSTNRSGHLTWDEIKAACRAGDDHEAATGLICLENTHNAGGGSVMNADQSREICENAHALGISVHIDGARVFNARGRGVGTGGGGSDTACRFGPVLPFKGPRGPGRLGACRQPSVRLRSPVVAETSRRRDAASGHCRGRRITCP